jgi:hypothetical protein
MATSASARPPVDGTDWLKAGAILLVSAGHFGQFFMEDDTWWSAIGCLAAPVFFFLIGFAQTRTVPLRWMGLGVLLTLLASWNAGWRWEAPNILLSFALIRWARPLVQALLRRSGWGGSALLVLALVAMLPMAEWVVEYGSEGWLWALFGLFQRAHVDGTAGAGAEDGAVGDPSRVDGLARCAGPMRLVSALVAAIVFLWQEDRLYSFSSAQFATLALGLGLLCAGLCRFRRGPSRVQPPEPVAGALRFVGRHTLEIYAIQLAASELIVKLVPGLAP